MGPLHVLRFGRVRQRAGVVPRSLVADHERYLVAREWAETPEDILTQITDRKFFYDGTLTICVATVKGDFKAPDNARFALVNGIREAFQPGTEPKDDPLNGLLSPLPPATTLIPTEAPVNLPTAMAARRQ